MLQAYVAATTASVVTALTLNRFISKRPALANGLIGRLVPLAAVAAANCVNIPLMRQRELIDGISVEDSNGESIGKSVVAAQHAVAQVIPSRILMAAPAMFIPPVVMNVLERRPFLQRNPVLKAPVTVLLTGACLAFSTPLCCALFPQKSSLQKESLESELQIKLPASQDFVVYNKGL